MSSIIQNIDASYADILSDSYVKDIGENGHVQYKSFTDTSNFDKVLTEIYFNMVGKRGKTTSIDNEKNEDVLFSSLQNAIELCVIHRRKKINNDYLKLFYRLLAGTRDIIDGKGERHFSYRQIFLWESIDLSLAKHAIDSFVEYIGDNGQLLHPLGSWKDVKYIAKYARDCGSHELTDYCVEKFKTRIEDDYKIMKEGKPISLACKWCPREKSSFKWMYVRIVREMYKEYFTAKNCNYNKAFRKASREFRQKLSEMNKYVNTVQINMCGGNWKHIDFNKVPSISMNKYRLAFMNKKNGKQRTEKHDRIICAKNLSEHLQKVQAGKGKVHGKRVDIFSLVAQAGSQLNEEEIKLINLQWKDLVSQISGLQNIIPMADVSGSMTCDGCIPLNMCIGLSILVSEKNNDAFKNRLITFSSEPSWVQLNDEQTFVEKVKIVKQSPWGMSTNFYKALTLILDVIKKNNIPPTEVENMTLAIFSDMQIDCASKENTKTMFGVIEEMYRNVGLDSEYKTPYKPPHILFWNLRNTGSMPVSHIQKNVTTLSGYSPTLLKVFCDKGPDAMAEYSPIHVVKELLLNKRYNSYDDAINKCQFEKY